VTDTTPIRMYPYRKSYKEREIIRKETDAMVTQNIIRRSRISYGFPVTLVPKPDGSLRFCVDYRPLIKITLQDPHQLPRIDDIFDRLSGSYFFTTVDLKSGYWQIEMHPDSIQYTAFVTPDGHFEFLRVHISYPILRQLDVEKPFILTTDASGIAVGAILSQKDNNGYEYVVYYASKKLKNADVHYEITEKECLAVIWAISEFRVYLYRKKFTLITDHYALYMMI
jgi:hypothetical protein